MQATEVGAEYVDSPRGIRSGEELDIAKLTAYLRSVMPELIGDHPIEVSQFPGGHSNLTYLVRAGKRAFVLRRPPFGSKVKSAHDMGREYKVLSCLRGHYPLAPEPVAHCTDDAVMGAEFYVMRRVEGVILRKDIPPGLDLSAARLGALHEHFVDNLVALHALDYNAIGLGDLGRPSGYVRRQVEGWTRRYSGSKTDDIPAIERAAAWLGERIPDESGASLIHNDYKLDNLVLNADDPREIIGVLDWEMSTVGDPLMDLGTTLSYWIVPTDSDEMQTIRWGPTHLPGGLDRQGVAERYAAKSGRDISNLVYYYVFGLFKTAVVLQQIYFRYKQGLTKDPRFALLIEAVKALAISADRAAQAGRI
jgi:aminoglycoside phosphotransferase (APT) family kinase protein